ncbi:MAG: EamA family transporter [Beduini sp.]|uniref:EamA family transporter n=1 Tax=Beduini sp. TaxID=1922300 RepID=UPI00399F37EB
MSVIIALLSAFFAGITSILVKVGVQKVDSSLATALRTIIVLICSWLMVFVVGSFSTLPSLSLTSLFFLILSGLTTGASWICYFKALQLGDINKVVPIDKSSTILTMILAFIFLKEPLTLPMILGILFMGVGTALMIQKKETSQTVKSKAWLGYALLSAVFASVTSILGKVGIENVESNLGTAIRTIVVLMMAWLIVFMQHKQSQIKEIDCRSWLYLILSGVTTGLSWLCFYKALQIGQASIVIPIDKLSILVSIGFAYFVFKERLSKKAFLGLILIVIGTFTLLIK